MSRFYLDEDAVVPSLLRKDPQCLVGTPNNAMPSEHLVGGHRGGEKRSNKGASGDTIGKGVGRRRYYFGNKRFIGIQLYILDSYPSPWYHRYWPHCEQCRNPSQNKNNAL